MALDPGSPSLGLLPFGPLPLGAPAAPYSVLVAVVEEVGQRVREAAATTQQLSGEPGLLPAAVQRGGSAALRVAADDFAGAWAREARAVAHDARLLADALTTAAASYRSTEWAVGAAVGPALLAVARQP